MNKQCKSCGSNVSNQDKFCQVCGGTDFITNNQTSNNPNDNQSWQHPVPQKKTKKLGSIIAIIVGVLLVLVGLIVVTDKVFQELGFGDIDNSSEEFYYSKGTFDGNVYINKWADIMYELPEGFSNADLATYNSAENSNTECGFYFIADDTMGLIYICYEKLPTEPVYDEEEYLDSVMKSLQDVAGITYEIPNTYTTESIGGYIYAKAECGFNNGNGNFANTFYVRKLDNYMIVVSAVGANSDFNDALVNNITTAK